jgi:hypothetical protein
VDNVIIATQVVKGYAAGAVIINSLTVTDGDTLTVNGSIGTPCCMLLPTVTGTDTLLLGVKRSDFGGVVSFKHEFDTIRHFHVTDVECQGSYFRTWFSNWLKSAATGITPVR